MPTIAEEKQYEERIKFYAARLDTCGYRFYDMVQTRAKQVPKLKSNYNNEALHSEIQEKVLHSADVFINCLHGDHNSTEIPEYLQSEATSFKRHFYTNLAPKYILEDERLKLLSTIFGNLPK